MSAWLRCAACALLVASVCRVSTARAEYHDEGWHAGCVDALTDEEVAAQLAFIEHSFRQQRAGAIAWWSGWTAFNAFNVVFGWWKFANAETRLAYDSWLVSAIGASMFVAQVTILPMTGMYGQRRMRKWPERTPEERRDKLRRALDLLDRAAEIEDTNSNWIAHLAGAVYAAGSSAYVWIRNRDADPGKLALAVSLQFATSIGVAELTFWTVPRRARRDHAYMRDEVCTPLLCALGAGRMRAEAPARSWGLTFHATGAALSGRF